MCMCSFILCEVVIYDAIKNLRNVPMVRTAVCVGDEESESKTTSFVEQHRHTQKFH